MSEVVNRCGVTWVASAGNDGPALCTVGTPPDIHCNTVIGVGAYVSPAMMTAMYSTRQKLPGTPYTWSSRGPTMDGDRGGGEKCIIKFIYSAIIQKYIFSVTVCAPGGAITSVPKVKGNDRIDGCALSRSIFF